jgi:hypothetical protein
VPISTVDHVGLILRLADHRLGLAVEGGEDLVGVLSA